MSKVDGFGVSLMVVVSSNRLAYNGFTLGVEAWLFAKRVIGDSPAGLYPCDKREADEGEARRDFPSSLHSLPPVAELVLQNCQADAKIIESRNFKLPLHPPLRQGVVGGCASFLSVVMKCLSAVQFIFFVFVFGLGIFENLFLSVRRMGTLFCILPIPVKIKRGKVQMCVPFGKVLFFVCCPVMRIF